MMNILEWFEEQVRPVPAGRRHPRKLEGYFWNGGTAVETEVREIGDTGALLVTPERWYLGTFLNLTLHCHESANGAKLPDPLTLLCKVVSHQRDGMEVRFIFARRLDRKALKQFVEALPCIESPGTPGMEQ